MAVSPLAKPKNLQNYASHTVFGKRLHLSYDPKCRSKPSFDDFCPVMNTILELVHILHSTSTKFLNRFISPPSVSIMKNKKTVSHSISKPKKKKKKNCFLWMHFGRIIDRASSILNDLKISNPQCFKLNPTKKRYKMRYTERVMFLPKKKYSGFSESYVTQLLIKQEKT